MQPGAYGLRPLWFKRFILSYFSNVPAGVDSEEDQEVILKGLSIVQL